MSAAEPKITHNGPRKRFELLIDGKLSLIEYTRPRRGTTDGQTLALTHTEVHPDLEGQGVGSNLVKQVLTYAEQQGQKIVPLCSFIAVYIKRHPDWQRIVSTEYDATDF